MARVKPRPGRTMQLSTDGEGSIQNSPLFVLGLLAVTLAIKLVVVWQLHDHPLVQPDVGLDTTAYADLAHRVRNGDLWLGPGLYFVSPLYVYFLASALSVADSFTWVRVLQVALGTISVGLIFITGRWWFGRRAGWLAAGLAALCGLFTFYEVLILQASIDAVLTSLALWALARALARDSLRWALLTGIVFGIASLNRPNMILALIGVAIAMALTRRFRLSLLLACGLLVGLSPAAIRNQLVSHEWSFASSHGGLNLYIGNSETATGFYHQLPGITPNIAGQSQDARRVAERALGRPLTDAEVSDYYVDLAWTWTRTYPGAAIALFARKLGYVFHAQHIALPYSFPFYAYDARTLLALLVVGPWLLIPLGLVGLIWAAPEGHARSAYLVWCAFVPSYALAVAVFFVAERYRLPLLVPLAIGAGAALDRAITMMQRKSFAAAAWPAGIMLAIGLLANWPLGLSDGRWDEGLRMAERLAILGRDAEADAWIAKLEPAAPRHGVLDFTVGMQQLAAKRTSAAIMHLTRAQQLDPGQPNVEYALGQALIQGDRTSDALPYLQRGFDAGTTIRGAGYDLARAYQAGGNLDAAAATLRRIRPADDDDHEAWLRLGRLASEVRAPDVAEPFFQRAVAMRPELAATHQQYGLLLVVIGRFEDAVRELTAAARIDSRDPDTLSHLAVAEAKLNRLDDARAHAMAALAINANDALARQIVTLIDRR